MIETIPSTMTVPSRRVLCSEGQHLHALWIEALATHDPDKIYPAMKAYFIHINGGKILDACPGCGSFKATYGKNI